MRYWVTLDLDRILELGDELYTTLGYIDGYLSFEELPIFVTIENYIINVERQGSTLSGLILAVIKFGEFCQNSPD